MLTTRRRDLYAPLYIVLNNSKIVTMHNISVIYIFPHSNNNQDAHSENGAVMRFFGCVNFVTSVYKVYNILCIILFENTIYCVFLSETPCNF